MNQVKIQIIEAVDGRPVQYHIDGTELTVQFAGESTAPAAFRVRM